MEQLKRLYLRPNFTSLTYLTGLLFLKQSEDRAYRIQENEIKIQLYRPWDKWLPLTSIRFAIKIYNEIKYN